MKEDLGWLVMLSVLITVIVIGGLGSLLNFSSTTVLWLIFGAIIAIGRALLRGQAAGVGCLIDNVEALREDLRAFREKRS